MALGQARFQTAGAARHPAGQVDQVEADGLHPPAPKALAERQALHGRVKVVGQDHEHPPGRVLAEIAGGEFAPGQVAFHHRARLLASSANVTVERLAKAERLEKIKVDRKPRMGSRALVNFCLLVMERKNALCHNGFTSLVMVIVIDNIITSRSHGTNEVFYFLGGGLGGKVTIIIGIGTDQTSMAVGMPSQVTSMTVSPPGFTPVVT